MILTTPITIITIQTAIDHDLKGNIKHRKRGCTVDSYLSIWIMGFVLVMGNVKWLIGGNYLIPSPINDISPQKYLKVNSRCIQFLCSLCFV